VTGVISPLTTGTTNEDQAVASPDGKSILYTQLSYQMDVISVSLLDGTTTTLISTGRYEGTATWSAAQAKLVWATNRSGSYQLWMHTPDGSERPVVTGLDFPEGGSLLWSPSLSPDGKRLIYVQGSKEGVKRLWISSLSGGTPVRLTNVEPGTEYGGAWSPDGSRFVYLQVEGGKSSIMVTKTSGNAAPVLLKQDVVFGFPDWSPSGDWITYRDEKGWNLISPDGKKSNFLGKIASGHLAFSKNGKLLYGIQTNETEGDGNRATLFSLDPVSLKMTPIKELGKDFIPAWPYSFSVAPDGNSAVFSVSKRRYDLWMLTGYRQPGLWNQIKDALHLTQADNNLKTENH
jgi:Tol biopolymer transport system component